MKRNLISKSVLTILSIIFSISIASSQQQTEQPVVDKEKINKSILMYEKISNIKIPENNLAYIKDTISSPELTLKLDEWEDANNISLVEDMRLVFLVEYLNVEGALINLGEPKGEARTTVYKAIYNHLDSIRDDHIIEPMGFKNYPMGSSGQVKYGKLPLSSIPDKGDVYFDNNYSGKTDKTWVLIVGEHLLTMKKEGYKDYNKKITIIEGENQEIRHEFVK